MRSRLGVREHQRHRGRVEHVLEIHEHLERGVVDTTDPTEVEHDVVHIVERTGNRPEDPLHRCEVEVAFELVDDDAVRTGFGEGVGGRRRAHPIRVGLVTAVDSGG